MFNGTNEGIETNEKQSSSPDEALTDSANRKLAVTLAEDIESIQQCVQEATVHRHGVAAHMTWPHELLLLKALGPQAQAIALPVEDPDAITPPIGEHVQRWLEHIAPQVLMAVRNRLFLAMARTSPR